MVAGGLAGASSNFMVYPLDFIRTRLGADVHVSKDKRQFKGFKDLV